MSVTSTEKLCTLLYSLKLWTLLGAQDFGLLLYGFKFFRPIYLVLLIGNGARGAKAEVRSAGKGWIARSYVSSDEGGVQ